MKLGRLIHCGLLVILGSSLLFGQSPGGMGQVRFGSYFSSNLDTINLYNGNLMLDIPLFSLPGRDGLSTDLRLRYNSQAWSNESTMLSTIGVYRGGWFIANAGGTGGNAVPYLVDCDYTGWPEALPTGYWEIDVYWTDASGATHTYQTPGYYVGPEHGGCDNFNLWYSWTTSVWLTSNAPNDRSIARLEPSGVLSIHFEDGRIFKPDTPNGLQLETRNGNYANVDPNTGLFNMLGRTITRTGGALSSTETYDRYTIYDADGNQQHYQLNYENCDTVYNPIEATSECLFQLKSIVLPNNRSYSFTYAHNQGFLTRVDLPSGGFIEYDYVGGLSSTDVAENYVVARRVSADGSSDVQWDYARTPSGSNRVIAVTDPEGHVVEHTFNSNGYEIQTVWKNEGTTTVKTVNITRPTGLPEEIVTIMGSVSQTQTMSWYNGRLTETTQSDWYTGLTPAPMTKTIYSYDIGCTGNPCQMPLHSQVELQGWNGSSYVTQGKTVYLYDQHSLATVGTVSNHHTPSFPRWNLTNIRRYRDASNYVEDELHYDVLGNVVETVDPRDKHTYISFIDNFTVSPSVSTYAFPTLVTNAKQHTNETEYNFDTGLPVKVTDARDLDTTFTYDLLNRPETITRENSPNNSVVTYCYDDDPAATSSCYDDQGGTLGVIQQTTLASGVVRKTITFVDRLSRPVKTMVYDPDDNVYSDTEYNAVGNVKRASAPYREGGAVAWAETEYDVLGRPTRVENPDSTEVTFAYSDNKVTSTDEAGNQRRQTVNALGQLTKVEEPDPFSSGYMETNYSYYVSGPLYQVAQGTQTRTFSHDWLGRMTSEVHPETGTTSYTYFADGLVASRTDARNKTVTYSYDAIGRPLTITYDDSTPDLDYEYDENGFNGFLTTVDVDGVMDSTFEYDLLGNLTEENVTIDGLETLTAGYTYDLGGRLSTVTYPSGRVVTQTYKAENGVSNDRLLTLTDSQTSATLVGSVAVNAAGAVTARTFNGVISETREFNSRNQLTHTGASANSTTLLDMGYGYGSSINIGKIRSRTDAVQPEHSANYTFDEIGRLTAADGASWGISWDLDRYGNRLSQTPSGLAMGRIGSPSLAYANNKVTATSTQYDAAGNLTYDGTGHYVYDAENRLTQINSSQVEYAYDYAGRRISRKVGSVTTYYFYGLTGLMSEFSTESGSGSTSSDRLEYRIGEPTGTAVLLLDAAGTPRENNRVFPFGEPWLAFAGSTNNEKFTTYQHDNDAGTDLDYAMARYYGSRSGRFMTPDPGHVGANVGDPQSWNAYAYSLNDPINFVDLMGTCPTDAELEAEGLSCDYWANHFAFLLTAARLAITSPVDLPGVVADIVEEHKRRREPKPEDCTAGGQFLCDCNGNKITGWSATTPSAGISLAEDPMFLLAGFAASKIGAMCAARVASGGVAATGDHIVLGLKAFGLEETARRFGGRTLLSDPSWQATLKTALGNPNTRFTISLDGVSGASTYSQFMSAAQKGLTAGAGPFNWEMGQVYQAARHLNVTFVRGGEVVANPFR